MNRQSVLQAKRPGLVVLMVVLRVVNALFGLLTAFLLLSSGAPDVRAVGTVIASLSILSLIFTVGLWMLRRWARLLTIGLAIVGLPLAIFGIVASGGLTQGPTWVWSRSSSPCMSCSIRASNPSSRKRPSVAC